MWLKQLASATHPLVICPSAVIFSLGQIFCSALFFSLSPHFLVLLELNLVPVVHLIAPTGALYVTRGPQHQPSCQFSLNPTSRCHNNCSVFLLYCHCYSRQLKQLTHLTQLSQQTNKCSKRSRLQRKFKEKCDDVVFEAMPFGNI